MLRIQEIFANIKSLDEVTILVTVLNMQEVKDFVIFLNTENQLRLGLDAKGDILGFYKSFAYASFKDRRPGRKAPFGVIDLRLDGDYFKTFVMNVLSNGDFIIDSNTIKPERDLRDIVGISQFFEGLISSNFDLFIEKIQPLFNAETKKAIFK